MNVAEVLRLCYDKALASPDPSTQNAAVLCLEHADGRLSPFLTTLACNRFPRGVAYKAERWERPLKYSYVEHAERNSLFEAAKQGRATGGLTMVCPWAACADCARAIVQTGLRKLITLRVPDRATNDRWKDSIDVAFQILAEGGVEVDFFDGKVGGEPIRRDGKLWQP